MALSAAIDLGRVSKENRYSFIGNRLRARTNLRAGAVLEPPFSKTRSRGVGLSNLRLTF